MAGEISDPDGIPLFALHKPTRAPLEIEAGEKQIADNIRDVRYIGRDTPAIDLLLLTRRTLRYMGDITNNIAGYLENENYLENAAE
ncbi:MAG TPA: hypothetical protein VHW69_09675 [Rhizomicrobium sp.]|jgi:hypothetical protein|nr:hypothetical protein [Rhizomicrobium sp.]